MPETKKESDLYRVYKLAQQDIQGFLRTILLIIANFSVFSLASLFSLNTIKSFSINNLIFCLLFWFLGFSFLVIFALSSKLKHLFVGLIIFSLAFFVPNLLLKQWFSLYWYLLLVVFALLVVSSLEMRAEANNLISLNWPRIVKKGSILLSWVFIILMIYFVYLANYNLNKDFKSTVSSVFDFILAQSLKLVPNSSYPLNGTVDDFLKNVILKQNEINIDKTLKGKIEEQLLKESRDNISKMIGLNLKGDEKISQVLVDTLYSKWQTFNKSIKIGIYFLIFLILLSIVSLLNVVFSFILITISWILKEILITVKFIKKESKGIEKEIISLE